MDHVIAARAQMGTSLAFHIVFAALAIGLPVLMLVVEGIWLRTRDPDYYRIARTWSKATAVLFVVGALSGTILSFEIGLLFPVFMEHAGAIIGIPFSMEGFAFFIEAIFVALYLYGWDRLSPRIHWLCSIPIAISGTASAAFITIVNAWMNLPTGFKLVDGKVTDVDPLAAMFSPAAGIEILHATIAAFVFTGFAVGAVYAWSYLRGNRAPYIVKAMQVAVLMGAIAIPIQMIVGDTIARFDGDHEPWKLAAMEALWHSQAGAPLTIGGLPNVATQTTSYAIEIPYLLSLLVYLNPNATVAGLNTIPRDQWAPIVVTHLSFDTMVGTGSVLLLIAAWWAIATVRRRRAPPSRWLLGALALAGPIVFVALQTGWYVTEFGRQPWIVHGYLRTADTVTTAPGLDVAFALFTLLYVVMAAMTWWLLVRIAQARGMHAEPGGKLTMA